MQRRFSLTCLGSLATIGMLVSAASAVGAVDAHLDGAFHVRGKIVSGNMGNQGSSVERIWRFKPLCRSGPCQRVRLARQAPGPGPPVKSKLHRVKRGTYKGRELVKVVCSKGSGHGHQIAHIKLRIRKRNDAGKATEIRGRAKFRVFDCPGKPHQVATIKGRLI